MKEYQLHGLRALAQSPKGTVPAFLQAPATQGAWRFHHALEDYGPTPLVRLNGLAEELGLGGVFVKDESHRFGLNAFKGLGGIYALSRAVARELGLPAEVTLEELQAPSVQKEVRNMVFVTTTDGNHGRGVAWAARKLGCEAVIHMDPLVDDDGATAAVRDQVAALVKCIDPAIVDAGAVEARVLPLGYDDAVRYAAQQAQEKGWTLIQDTSWPGYEEIPTWIVQGYTTLAREAADQLAEAGVDRPTHVFLQAGVGAMAGGVLGYLADRYGAQAPVFAVVEPENVAGIYASAQAGDGQPHPAQGPGETIMAGLNCAEPCTLTWPVLRDLASWYIACPDQVAERGMRRLGRPAAGDPAVISGESGGVTMGLLALLMTAPDLAPLRRDMGLNRQSVVLLISTEGDTDPVHYQKVMTHD